MEYTRETFPFTVTENGWWCCGMPGCYKEIPVAKKTVVAYHKSTHFPKHQCEHCGELFPQKSRLEVHVRTAHTGEKPYACPHCDRAYPQLSNLQDHVRKTHVTEGGRKPIPFTSPYAIFYKAELATLQQERPGVPHKELVAEIGRRWRAHKADTAAKIEPAVVSLDPVPPTAPSSLTN